MCVCRNVVSEPLTLKLQIKSSYIRSPWNLVPSSGLTSCHSADNIRWKVIGHWRIVLRQCGLERHSRYEHSVNEALHFTVRSGNTSSPTREDGVLLPRHGGEYYCERQLLLQLFLLAGSGPGGRGTGVGRGRGGGLTRPHLGSGKVHTQVCKLHI